MTPLQELVAKLVVAVFGLGLIALGLSAARGAVGGVSSTFIEWRTQRQRRRWPSVPGQIVRSRLGGGSATKDPPAMVEYHYEINGVRHEGSQSDFDTSEAEKIVARYEKGAAVQIFYDPDDPQKSVLNRERGGGCFALCWPIVLLALAIALIAGGVGILGQHGVFRK